MPNSESETIVGRVAAIWRYPVKSMMGEQLTRTDVSHLGLPGDRGWAVRDDTDGEIRGAKKLPRLLQCSARYRTEPRTGEATPVAIDLPGDIATGSDDPAINARLSELLERPASLWPLRPADDEEHYRRREALTEPVLRELLGREPDMPLPDLNDLPPDLLRSLTTYATPPGTYFDAYPLHLMTTSWMEVLAASAPDQRFEVERFRPNFVIDGAPPGLAELDWCGKRLRIGGIEISCDIPTLRCSMTAHATGDLPKDPLVLRTIVQETGQNAGVYANVEVPGRVEVGDPVELVS